MALASRVGAHMTDNRNPSTKAAVAVGAKERLTSSWWVLLSLLAPLALFHSSRYEFSFMVGNTGVNNTGLRTIEEQRHGYYTKVFNESFNNSGL